MLITNISEENSLLTRLDHLVAGLGLMSREQFPQEE